MRGKAAILGGLRMEDPCEAFRGLSVREELEDPLRGAILGKSDDGRHSSGVQGTPSEGRGWMTL